MSIPSSLNNQYYKRFSKSKLSNELLENVEDIVKTTYQII